MMTARDSSMGQLRVLLRSWSWQADSWHELWGCTAGRCGCTSRRSPSRMYTVPSRVL